MINITLMNDEQLRSRSMAEVKQIPDLYSEHIFGSIRPYRCACPSSPLFAKGDSCAICKVTPTDKTARRTRTAHIELPFPIINPLFIPAVMKVCGMKSREFFACISGLDAFATDSEGNITSGGDPASGWSVLYNKLHQTDFIYGVPTEDIMLSVLPVLPPLLRADGDIAKNSVNTIYEAIIQAKNAIKAVNDMTSTIRGYEIAAVQGRIQQLASFLFDTNIDKQFPRPMRFSNGRKSVSIEHVGLVNRLTGKRGNVRGALLGKRTDFSARSMHGGERTKNIDTCLLPYRIARKLFEPQLINVLHKEAGVMTRAQVLQAIADGDTIVDEVLEQITKNQVVIINRAPTLHKAGMLALYIELTYKHHISLPHMTYGGLCADVDGDTLAVYMPMSAEAQEEAQRLMLPSANMLTQRDHSFAYYPSHEGLAGLVYGTIIDMGKETYTSRSVQDVKYMLDIGMLDHNSPVLWKPTGEVTCAGRIIVADIIGLPVQTAMRTNYGKPLLKNALMAGHDMVRILDELECFGYDVVHSMGMSINLDDLTITPEQQAEVERLAVADRAEQERGMDNMVKDWRAGKSF